MPLSVQNCENPDSIDKSKPRFYQHPAESTRIGGMMQIRPGIHLGRFTPGDSLAHRLDTRIKVIITGFFSVAVWNVNGAAGLALMSAVVLGWAVMARSAARQMIVPLRGMTIPGLFILVYYLWSGVSFGGPGLAGELLQALGRTTTLLIKTGLALAAAAWLYLYTPPLRVVDAIGFLLSPLERLKVPVRQFSFSVGLILRFFPEAVTRVGEFYRTLQLREMSSLSRSGLLTRALATVRRGIDTMVLYMHYSLHSSHLVAQGLLTRGYNPYQRVQPSSAANPALWEYAVLILSCSATAVAWLWL
jgi:energy-coupling factor transporter transmembrane protein EcfT